MKSQRFKRHVPRSLLEAITILGDLQAEDCRVLAGGQSLVPMMAFRMAQPANLVDINEIAGLGQTKVDKGFLTVDPLVRHAQFGKSVAPGPTGSLLTRVMRDIAHFPIRTRGTFCGSLAHADPSSEWCLVAATLGASVLARSLRGTREIAADDLFEGLMATSLEPDEMIVSARIPLLSPEVRWGFYEFARRPGDYAIAMSLVSYELSHGSIVNARIGLGGAESKPRRITEAEGLLEGKPPTSELFRNAAEIAASHIEPMEDLQADERYRRDLVKVVIHRALESAGSEASV